MRHAMRRGQTGVRSKSTAANLGIRMPDAQFDFMRDVLAAPSPVGLEAR